MHLGLGRAGPRVHHLLEARQLHPPAVDLDRDLGGLVGHHSPSPWSSTSPGVRSLRRPLYAGWRSSPCPLSPSDCTSATRTGCTHVAPAESSAGTSVAKGDSVDVRALEVAHQGLPGLAGEAGADASQVAQAARAGHADEHGAEAARHGARGLGPPPADDDRDRAAVGRLEPVGRAQPGHVDRVDALGHDALETLLLRRGVERHPVGERRRRLPPRAGELEPLERRAPVGPGARAAARRRRAAAGRTS